MPFSVSLLRYKATIYKSQIYKNRRSVNQINVNAVLDSFDKVTFLSDIKL